LKNSVLTRKEQDNFVVAEGSASLNRARVSRALHDVAGKYKF